MIYSAVGEELSTRKIRDCNFITLQDKDKVLFEKVKLLKNATNYIIWYKKDDVNKWGVTIKSFDKSDNFPSQHTWKVTWESNGVDSLVPSKASEEMTEIISGISFEKLLEIKNNFLNNKKKK